MAGKLSFSIALNLLTENFKKGTSAVKNGLRSMQMQVLTFAAALGAGGLGLGNFVSRLIEVARETSRVTTALKNVSGSTAQYADNQRFLLGMAKKYGLEINALTGNYAKFTAASQVSGMSLLNQRKIFESVSRACTAFSMSADDSNSVFLALSQMMSKGKISSEELRLQMGERLPIALQAMAKAAGVSAAGLDKLMKKGKVMSADVLPKFADALNGMIPNVDTDNLETSVNRLQNVFTAFTKKTGIQEYYKEAIDSITASVQYASNNIKNIISQLVAVLSGALLGKFFKWAILEIGKAERAALIAASKTAKAAKEKFDVVAWRAQNGAETMKMAFTRSINAIKVAFINFLPTAIITAITTIGIKLYEVRQEAKRIKSIFSSYKKESAVIGSTKEIESLKSLYSIASNVNESYNDRKKAVDQLNEKLGTAYKIDGNTLKINGDINNKISERIKLLQSAAAVDFYTQKKLDAQDKIDTLYSENGGENTTKRKAAFYARNSSSAYRSVFGDQKELKAYKEILELQKIVKDADGKIIKYTKGAFSENSTTATPDTSAGDSEKKTKLEKAEEAYIQSKKEYTNQLAIGAIKEEEYNKLVDELNKETYKKLAGLLTEKQAGKNKVFQAAKAGRENPLQSKTAEIENDYWKEMNELSSQYALNLISEKDYNAGITSLTEKTLQAAGSLAEIDAAGIGFIEALQAKRQELLSKSILPKEEKRDKTLDYRIKNPEQIEADKSNKEKYLNSLKSAAGKDADSITQDIKAAELSLDEIKKKYNALAPALVEALNKAMGEVKTLDEAFKIAQVKEDVKALCKELNESLYGGIKDIAGSTDRMVSAFQNINDVFSDVDSSGWERIMAIWNAMTQTVDSFMSILAMIENLTELTNKLTKAKQVEASIDAATTQQKITNNVKQAASEIATEGIVSAVNKKEVAGNTAAAASGAAKSVAGIPLVGLVMAGAAVAGIIAMMASLPKFARGGIVGGISTTGDNNLVRANAGEMILTRGQQSTLFQLANGKGFNAKNNSGGEVVFRIDGDKLVGVLSNYNRKLRRIN